MLLAWPHPEEAPHYAYVILPIVYAQGVLLRAQRSAVNHWLPLAVLAGSTVLALPSLLLTAQRYSTPPPPGAEIARHTQA